MPDHYHFDKRNKKSNFYALRLHILYGISREQRCLSSKVSLLLHDDSCWNKFKQNKLFEILKGDIFAKRNEYKLWCYFHCDPILQVCHHKKFIVVVMVTENCCCCCCCCCYGRSYCCQTFPLLVILTRKLSVKMSCTQIEKKEQKILFLKNCMHSNL